jgi:hypothetical protein
LQNPQNTSSFLIKHLAYHQSAHYSNGFNHRSPCTKSKVLRFTHIAHDASVVIKKNNKKVHAPRDYPLFRGLSHKSCQIETPKTTNRIKLKIPLVSNNKTLATHTNTFTHHRICPLSGEVGPTRRRSVWLLAPSHQSLSQWKPYLPSPGD